MKSIITSTIIRLSFFTIALSPIVMFGAAPDLNCPACCPQKNDQISENPTHIGAPYQTGNTRIRQGLTSEGCEEGYLRHWQSPQMEMRQEIGLTYIAFCNGEGVGCEKWQTYHIYGTPYDYWVFSQIPDTIYGSCHPEDSYWV